MRTIALLLLPIAAGCVPVQEQSISLAADGLATRMGPLEQTGTKPKVLVLSELEPATIEELVPYRGKRVSTRTIWKPDRCARELTRRLVESRPDAILVCDREASATGSTAMPVFDPGLAFGVVFTSTTTFSTEVVGYAMRATRARLPFAYNLASGTVVERRDIAACGDILEGDVVTEIGGAPALPPVDRVTWALYPVLLQCSVNDEIPVVWVRAGVGKMQGSVRLIPPAAPHLAVADSIDTRYMPSIKPITKDGRTVWAMPDQAWAPPETEGWVSHGPIR